MLNRTAKKMHSKRPRVSVSSQAVNLNRIEEHPIGTDFETNQENRVAMHENTGTCSLGWCRRDLSWIGIKRCNCGNRNDGQDFTKCVSPNSIHSVVIPKYCEMGQTKLPTKISRRVDTYHISLIFEVLMPRSARGRAAPVPVMTARFWRRVFKVDIIGGRSGRAHVRKGNLQEVK
jgi:hypothetical protein